LVDVTRWLAFRRGQFLSMGGSAEKPVLMMAAVQGGTAITAQAQG
jgi:hypothetical protein